MKFKSYDELRKKQKLIHYQKLELTRLDLCTRAVILFNVVGGGVHINIQAGEFLKGIRNRDNQIRMRKRISY